MKSDGSKITLTDVESTQSWETNPMLSAGVPVDSKVQGERYTICCPDCSKKCYSHILADHFLNNYI
jgi:hypothetical protein